MARTAPWLRRRGLLSAALVSGWMRIRGTRRRQSLDRGFVLSDHADWPGLMTAIEATGAARIWTTHGYRDPLARWLREKGLDAQSVETRYRAETEEEGIVKAFADLYAALDATTKTNEKIEALTRYLSAAPPEDAIWGISFLIGRRPKRLIESRKLAQWALEEARMPEWMFGECYSAVGDFAEVMALLLPPAEASTSLPLHYWVQERMLPMREWDDGARRDSIVAAWRQMDERQRFAWNKLLTGEFRVGVSQSLVVRAIAQVSGVDAAVISHRLMGDWQPTPEFAKELLAPDTRDADVSRPYPFFLAYPLEGAVEELGDIGDWQAEWKWDGIRAQLIRRGWRDVPVVARRGTR